jgi:hypothetical protein
MTVTIFLMILAEVLKIADIPWYMYLIGVFFWAIDYKKTVKISKE